MSSFVARYNDKGVTRSIHFDKILYDKEKASSILNDAGIKNFFFFFEPEPPQMLDENTMLFKGEVGFDITCSSLMYSLKNGFNVVLDSFGGDLAEGWKIYDLIKNYHPETKIGILGAAYSSAMQILLSAKKDNRWMTENSTGLIHAPWTYEIGDDEKLRETSDLLKLEKNKLANFYAKESGCALEKIYSIMKSEKILNASEMLEMNFVHEIRLNTNKNPEKMENKSEDSTKLNAIENLLTKISNFLVPQQKNELVQDVNGVELDFGEQEAAVGNTATANGETANGEYTMADGSIYVFENGTLIEIKEPESETEMEAENKVLKIDNETLKAENVELKTKMNKLESDAVSFKAEATKQVDEITREFSEFKNKFSNENPDTKNTPVEPKKTKSPFSYNKK